ncbi:epsin family protein [Skeletonema marinoi]|uniref:Epsin family protein n=1 Tax=Skeletonema marinoi TaxID=267567 RepID=A0AAD9DFE9_9STRA|nr:epsin family protein [Skeletonema marinoi]
MDLVGNFVKDLNIDKVRNLAEDAFNQVKPKNDVEVRVYEVLSHKNWGASGTLMNEIAQDTFDYERFLIVTKLMWEAIETPRPAAWRVIFKGLTLLEHLVKNGSERCVDDARNHSHLLRSMDRFNYYEGTVDRGQGVREKAKQVTDILGDDERIREERTKARQLREKFAGRSMTTSSSGGGGGGGGGGGSSKYAGYGNSDAGWNSKSAGYGESGIGAASSGRDSSDRGYAGRYGEGGVDSGTSRTSDAVPTRKSSKSGSSKVKKSKKKEKKTVAVALLPQHQKLIYLALMTYPLALLPKLTIHLTHSNLLAHQLQQLQHLRQLVMTLETFNKLPLHRLYNLMHLVSTCSSAGVF